jgi:hypothetical protein
MAEAAEARRRGKGDDRAGQEEARGARCSGSGPRLAARRRRVWAADRASAPACCCSLCRAPRPRAALCLARRCAAGPPRSSLQRCDVALRPPHHHLSLAGVLHCLTARLLSADRRRSSGTCAAPLRASDCPAHTRHRARRTSRAWASSHRCTTSRPGAQLAAPVSRSSRARTTHGSPRPPVREHLDWRCAALSASGSARSDNAHASLLPHVSTLHPPTFQATPPHQRSLTSICVAHAQPACAGPPLRRVCGPAVTGHLSRA